MISRTPIDPAQVIRDCRFGGKIVVGGFDVECIRWNKIVHIQVVKRLPKIHDDGRVTIRAFNTEYEVRATRCTLDSTGQQWVSFEIA